MLSRKISSYIKIKSNVLRQFSHVAKTKILPEKNDINKFTVGENYHGFQVKDVRDILEFHITAIHLIHEKTKAEYLHLFRNDNNNVFSINFRTTPLNSTGLPHILEHTVLCGSQLYPVRDPFFKMLNRSLATFMNAMTGSDYTMYPFSTQNWSDYRNLQKIYLDAAFRPNLNELDFMQEGWRLENVDPNDQKTPLTIKGVVYNEMKGVFSENENILAQKLQNLILPDHTYGVISGGDPMDIPNLTWEDLKQFHRDHYHPSNSRFYSYGNFPLEPTLQYINNEYLDKFEYQEPKNTVVPKQSRWNEEKNEHVFCRLETMGKPFEKQNYLTVSLLLSDITDFYETFLMQFVTELLIKGPNSPFYKALIEPNFSGGYTSTTGFDSQPRDSVFTIGLQGLKQNDFPKIIDIYNKTIDDVIKTGFTQEHIESVLHRYELLIKHETRNFGLNLLFGIAATWNHTNNIIDSLEMNSLINKLKTEVKNNPQYLQNVVQKYFKDNKHRLILTMSPDKEYDKKLEEMEHKLIEKKTKNLSDSDKKVIYEKGLELQKQQNEQPNMKLLPTLTMDDINEDVERIPREHAIFDSVQTQINHVNSNGIVYFKALLNILDLSQEQQMLLPLFCYVIDKLGTAKLNYREFDNLVNLTTDRLSFNSHIGESLYHLHTYEPGILLSSYCLEKNLDKMFDLWSQIFNITELKDVERFKMLVELYMSNLTHGIVDSGHIYAMQAAAGLVSGSAYQTELLSGLHHIAYMKRLVHTSNYQAMLQEIVNIANILFDKNKMRVALNISPENRPQILKSYQTYLKNIPSQNNITSHENSYVTGKVWASMDAVNCEHYVLNIPVNYCSKAILTAPYQDSDYAKLRVLARLLTSKYLHPELREKQGAYGGGARLTNDGVFTFYSYRDPRSVETLDVFDESYKWLNHELDKVTDQDVLEAKLGVFQAVDAPVPPSSKGCNEFLLRLTPDILQRHRADIMTVDQKALKEVTEKYLSNSNISNTGKVLLGPKSDKVDNSKRPDELWTVVDNV